MTIDDACWLCLEPIEGQRINGGHYEAGKTPAGWNIIFASHPGCFETYSTGEYAADRLARGIGT